jgi:hypothetical protein
MSHDTRKKELVPLRRLNLTKTCRNGTMRLRVFRKSAEGWPSPVEGVRLEIG